MGPAVCKSIKKFSSVQGSCAPQQTKGNKIRGQRMFSGKQAKKKIPTPNEAN